MERTLCLGILAHVDAGKTTLTERLLYAAGVIEEMGSVDAGTTQTDSLALERRRGITIRSAVACFAVGEVIVNLIDTPGHPDFIAEVERSLTVLDGAVLVVSAVEGVQPQTRLLMRALDRLAVPTVLFVNKIDRPGADPPRVLAQIAARLSPAVVPLGSVSAAGSPTADSVPDAALGTGASAGLVALLAEHDEALLSDYVAGTVLPQRRLWRALSRQTRRCAVHPVLFGSALTGAGTDLLINTVTRLLPAERLSSDGPPFGRVFKIERDGAGERQTYVRMHGGTLHLREPIGVGGLTEDAPRSEMKVTEIRLLSPGGEQAVSSLPAGRIGKLRGVRTVRVGDVVGMGERGRQGHRFRFAPPTLETVVDPADRRDGGRLRAALGQLADEDPLIRLRPEEEGRAIAVSLYGEVQKQVLSSVLADEYGIVVTFRDATPIYVERPRKEAEATEWLHGPNNPYNASIGLRIEAGPPESGLEFRIAVDSRSMPLYVYRTAASFSEHMRTYVSEALLSGLAGWEVVDCVVTMTTCMYCLADGPPSRRGPTSTAADFRKLTPIVVREALELAGTVVCEPMVAARMELPTDSLSAVFASPWLAGVGVATVGGEGRFSFVEATMRASAAHRLHAALPGLTSGEGVLETTFAGYAPMRGGRVGRGGGAAGSRRPGR